MPQQDGVEIYGRFYPWPDRFRLGDPVLVREVTGMSWPEFTAALEEQEAAFEAAREVGEEPPDADQVVIAGLVAVSFWQGNPHMSRQKARSSVERIPQDKVEIVEGDDVDPPAEAAGEPLATTSSTSDDSPEGPA